MKDTYSIKYDPRIERWLVLDRQEVLCSRPHKHEAEFEVEKLRNVENRWAAVDQPLKLDN